MRPVKYKNLGHGTMIRVPNLTAKILPDLQDFMQEIEESGRDSVEILSNFFDSYKESMRS
jgi:hypothetical protein